MNEASTLAQALATSNAELYAALAKVQEKLPAIEKTKTAVIKHRDGGGQHSYKYADLADVAAKVMPLLGVNGLAFTAFPIHRPDGKFGLEYHLTHESGASLDGWYEIRTDGLTVQDVGGRITYARRYILCSVTGVAADEDTDAREDTPAAAQSPAKAVTDRVKAQRGKQQTPVVQPVRPPQPDANPAAPPAPPREHLAGPQECWCGRNDHSIMGTHLHAVTDHQAPSINGALHGHFTRLGFDPKKPEDRTRRLAVASALLGMPGGDGQLKTFSDLTELQARSLHNILSRCKNWDAVQTALDTR